MMCGIRVAVVVVLCVAAAALAEDEGDVIGDDPDMQLATDIEWDEIANDDVCQQKAAAHFQYLSTGLRTHLQHQVDVWLEELSLLNETSSKYRHNRTVSRPDLVRKVQLVSYVGEALLPEEQRELVVNFSAEVQHVVRTGRVSCKGNCSLDVAGVEAGLAQHRDVEELRSLWLQWHELFLPLQPDYISMLQLTNDIATLNENPDAASYWLMLSEYPGSYEDARALWQQMESLYLKLHKYVRSRLESRYGRQALGDDPHTIPPYLLGSVGALDWTNIADIVLGEDNEVYATLQKNLKLQEVSGKKLYELADKLVQSMGFEGLHKEFWEESKFNATCHSEAVEYCLSGKTRVMTCEQATWLQFLEAHEMVMKAARQQVVSEQPYIFMNPNRQSAGQEAAVELLPLLAASAANLQRVGLLPAEVATSPSAAVSLQLLVALRTLPRLPYYLAADLWRLELLATGNVTVEDAALSWEQHKQNFLRVGTLANSSWWDFQPDKLMTSNKPYLAKFAGTILQFQMLELFQNKSANESVVVKAIQESDQLKQLLKDGLSAEWPVLLRTDLGIERVDTGALMRYFSSLEHFLDGQENATRPGSNRGAQADNSTNASGADGAGRNATSRSIDADTRASSIGSGILIGCVTVAIIGIVTTVFLVARRKFKRSRSDYHLAKTSPE